MDYKAILPLAELEKYSEMKGYMGKKIKITGVRYIVWITEKEFIKLGEICSQLDSKLEVFKQECTKLANQFMTEYAEQNSIVDVLDIFIDVLNKEIIKAENRKQIGTAELSENNGNT